MKILLFSFFIMLIGLLSACTEEIDLVAEGEVVPVIYAIFDLSDSVHTVRLSKSFADEKSVNEMIHNQQYLYYDSAHITMGRNQTTSGYTFQKIDDLSREEGYFPEYPNPVYQLHQRLNPGLYTLRIDLGDGSEPVVVTTSLISDLVVVYPGPRTKRIYFYDDPVSFIWFPSGSAYSYEIAFTLVYEEYHEVKGLITKSITYSRRIFEEEMEWMQDRFKAQIYSDPVYAYFGRMLKVDPQVNYRKPIRLISTVSTADQDLTQFISESSPNIDGRNDNKGNLENALGIVASKFSTSFPNMQLSPKAMDSLRGGRFTKNLNFIINPDW